MPGNPLTDPNWAPNLADTIERIVGSVRDKTTRPALIATRGLIFGLVIATGGLMALILLGVLVTRAFIAFFDIWTSHGAAVWITYFTFGGLLTAAGMLALSVR